MIRTIKLLGLMALAGLAMSAVFASGAQAQDGEFTAGATLGETETGEHTLTVATGEQYGSAEENLFTTDSGTTNCTNSGVSFSGEDDDGTGTHLTATPVYDECIANGTNPATVDEKKCDYTFNQPTMIAGSEHETWEGTVDLTCENPGEAIVVTAFAFGGTGHDGHATAACTITVLPAEDLGHVVYHNKPGEGEGEPTPKDYLTMDVTVSGITYEENGFGCANEEGGLTHNGTYESNVRVKADDPTTEDPDDHDLWISTAGE